MSYPPDKRLERMKELTRHMEERILMCDDEQDLIALASMMLVTGKSILSSSIGKEGTKQLLRKLYEEI